MANFVHFSNVNSLFKKKNEQVWQSRNQAKLASPTLDNSSLLSRPKKRLSLKLVISVIIFALLFVGGVSAMILSQMQQDVRQQASGCTYWNGEAATEGSYDNRGGIRQQCEGGYWSMPDDGITDPSGMFPEEEKEQLGCVMWDGTKVAAGAYDNRGGIRKQCVNGLWDHPDDGITDPNDVSSLALVETLKDIESGDIEYVDARKAYDQYCRANVDSTDVERCKSLENQLTDMEAEIRYSALDAAVGGNTNSVKNAISGLDDRSVDFNEARSVYREYCQGAKAQQTSSSACNSLKSELDEIESLVAQAETAKWTAMTDAATSNTEAVSNAIGGLDERTVDFNEARSVYREYCQGAKAQMTSGSACNSLKSELDAMEAQRIAAETARYTALTTTVQANTAEVTNALGGLEDRSVDLSEANTVYNEYCNGSKAQQTSSSACKALNDSIEEIENLTNQSRELQSETITTNTNNVNYAVSALKSGVMDSEAAQGTYNQYCVGAKAQQTSLSSCQNLQSQISLNLEVEVNPWSSYTDTIHVNNNEVDATITSLDNGEISIEDALAIEEKICDENGRTVSSLKCEELARSINRSFDSRRWQAYDAGIDENIELIGESVGDLEMGEMSIEDTQRIYQASCIGARSQHTPVSVCNDFKERLENADIFVSNFAVERVIPNEFIATRDDSLDSLIFNLADSDFTDYNFNVNFSPIAFREDLDEVLSEEAIEMSELGVETIYCNLNMVCEYYHDGVVDTVTFDQIVEDIKSFNLDDEEFASLRGNGVIVSGPTNSNLIRETNNELAPVEIRVCVRECEWIAPTDENLKGLAYTVISDADDLASFIPDMDGNGYVLDNDLDIYLANAPLKDLLEIIVTNDSNWNEYEAETLVSNYDSSDLNLLVPDELPYGDYFETVESFSMAQAVYDRYGLDMKGQSFWAIEEALNNVNQYASLERFSSQLSSIPIIRTLSSLIELPNIQIENCSTVSHDDVCHIQRSIINTVNASREMSEEVGTWEERTGVSLQYAGDMDFGTLMVFDYAIDLLPEYYWDGIDGVVVTSNDDVGKDSDGYTYMTGTFQMDQCSGGGVSCVNYGNDFWWRLKVIAHETAHNRQDVTVEAGNYCFEVGDCVEIEEMATGRDVLDEYLSEAGISVNPDDSLSVSASHDISYYDDEAYAFKNAKEFYAEILSDAILDPEGFAASDPELYRLAVIVNGFETETYIDENYIEMIRRKSQ